MRMAKGGWVYIMANCYHGGMYVVVTADLMARVHQHREGNGSDHVMQTGKTMLVYAERHEEIEAAIARDKLVKKWRREWKFALIEAENPKWDDLWEVWFGGGGERPARKRRRVSASLPRHSVSGPGQGRGSTSALLRLADGPFGHYPMVIFHAAP